MKKPTKEYRCECGRNLESGPQYWLKEKKKFICESCYKKIPVVGEVESSTGKITYYEEKNPDKNKVKE